MKRELGIARCGLACCLCSENELLDCLERNEEAGIVYHRDGINGDYDNFDDVEKLILFIKTGGVSEADDPDEDIHDPCLRFQK